MTVNLRIKKKNIDDNAIDGTKIKLLQNESVKAVDASGQVVDLVKLDASGNVLGNGYELAKKADLTQEVSSRLAADGSLDERLDVLEGDEFTVGSVAKSFKDGKDYTDEQLLVEKTARIAADDTLQNNIDTETNARIAADQDEQSARVAAIQREQSVRASADTSLQAFINDEVNSRISGDESLAQRLGSLEADENTDGSLLKIYKDAKLYTDTKINIEITSRRAADASLDERLDVVQGNENTTGSIAKAQYDAERYADSKVSDEAGLRAEGDSTINGRITSEIESVYNEFRSADTALNTRVSDETTNRVNGDNSLDSRLDVVQGDENTAGSILKVLKDAKAYTDQKALDANASLINAINTEASARMSADGSLAASDASLDARLDTVQGDENTAGSILKALKDAKNYTNNEVAVEKTRAMNAEASLNSKLDFFKENTDSAAIDSLKEIVDAFQSADGNLNNAISNISVNVTAELYAEITSRRAADTEIYSAISAEMQSRASAVQSEANARAAEDTNLSNRINTEINNRTSGDNSLATRIVQEANDRAAGDSSLDARLDTVQGDENTAGSILESLKQAKAYTDQKALDANTNLINAINEEVTSRQAAVSGEAASRVSGDNSLDARLDVVQGDENTAGSILESLKQARAYTDQEVTYERIRAINAETSLHHRLDFFEENVDNAKLDSLKEIVDAFQSADGNLNNAISNISVNVTAELHQEVSARIAADNSLDYRLNVVQGDLSTPGSVAKAQYDAERYADHEVSTEKARAEDAELSLENDISAEESARISADSVLDSRIALLEGDYLTTGSIANMLAQAKEYTNQEIDKEESARIADVNAEESARIEAINTEVEARTDADNQLAGLIEFEKNMRVSAINTEMSSRISADNSLTSKLNAETQTRQSAVISLENALEDETTYRITGDGELQGQIDGLLSRMDTVEIFTAEGGSTFDLQERSERMAADSSLESAISAEVTARQQAIADLVGAAPALLDTLKELSDALGQDANFATTITNRFTAIESSISIATQDGVTYTNQKHQEVLSLISNTLLKQESFVLDEEDVDNGYVEWPETGIILRSINAFADRLCIFEGADYSLTVADGVARLTFLNSLTSGGDEAVEEGDSIRITYWKTPTT